MCVVCECVCVECVCVSVCGCVCGGVCVCVCEYSTYVTLRGCVNVSTVHVPCSRKINLVGSLI